MGRKRYHLLTSAERDRVVQLSQQGVKIKYIAERLDICTKTVQDILKKRRMNART